MKKQCDNVSEHPGHLVRKLQFLRKTVLLATSVSLLTSAATISRTRPQSLLGFPFIPRLSLLGINGRTSFVRRRLGRLALGLQSAFTSHRFSALLSLLPRKRHASNEMPALASPRSC